MKNREQGKSELVANSHVRLFFALWPAWEQRQALHRLAIEQHDSCGGRVMREESIHLTILFLGATPVERMQELLQAAASVRVQPFMLELDRFLGWPHNGIAYVAPTDVPGSLLELSAKLRIKMKAAGFNFDRRAFTPHVTLMRKVEHVPRIRSIEGIKWQVEEFALVQSVQVEAGVRYDIVGRWPLGQT